MVDQNGNPVSGASVAITARASNGNQIFALNATTQSDGAYTIGVPVGTYDVLVNDNYGDQATIDNVVVTSGTTDTVNATVQATVGAVAGTITDASGTPIAGAQVSVMSTAGGGGGVLTASDGQFDVVGLQPGTYVVTVSTSNYAAQQPVTITAGQTDTVNVDVPINLNQTPPATPEWTPPL